VRLPACLSRRAIGAPTVAAALPALPRSQQADGAHLSLTPIQAPVDVVQLIGVEPA